MNLPRPNLAWIVVLALIIRASAIALAPDSLRDDPDAYAKLAVTWAESGILGIESPNKTVTPTAFRPPLYPWLLSWCVVPSENGRLVFPLVATLHVVLGGATACLTFLIATSLGFSRWMACVAGLGVALDPILLRQSQLIMTETLATFLAIALWWLSLRIWFDETCPTGFSPLEQGTKQSPSQSLELRRGTLQWIALVLFGATFGLSILARPTAAAWLGLFLLGSLFVGCRCWKRRIADSVLVFAVATACVAPWTLRNVAAFGQPIWSTTHGGYTLLLANNPILFAHFHSKGPSRNWDEERFHAVWKQRFEDGGAWQPSDQAFWFPDEPLRAPNNVSRWDELQDDRKAYLAAFATIADQPATFALSSLYRVGWLFALWPNNASLAQKAIVGLWYAGCFGLAIAGLATVFKHGRWRAWWIALSLAASLTIVHAVFWSNMRMRAPVMPVAYLLACQGIVSLFFEGWDKVRRKSRALKEPNDFN